MTSILLVDDNVERARAVASVISKRNRNIDLCVRTNVVDAKRELERRSFDLLLLDIHLPRRPDKEPEPDGGLELLRWLRTGRYAAAPRHIVGITAFESSMALAEKDFNNLIWRLLRVDLNDSRWQLEFEHTLDDLGIDYRPPFVGDGASHHIDLLIVTALEDPELKAILELPGGFEPIVVRNDASQYYIGSFEQGGRSLSVVAVAASTKGLCASAVAVTKAIFSFWPRFVYMPGITAGIASKTNIGDTVFASVCWDWGSGKLKDDDGTEIFHPAAYQCRLNESLAQMVNHLRDDEAFLYEIWNNYKAVKPDKLPSIKLGVMASGASVLQSDVAVKKVLDIHKDLLAIEMEAFSVMYACEVSCLPRPLAIVAKTVCDNGDSAKNDNFQDYTAYVSAQVLYKYALLAMGEAEKR